MKRRTARENAFIAAFEESFHPGELEEVLKLSRESGEYALDAFGEELVRTMVTHRAQVDALIEPCLKDWKLARISRVCRVILELAVSELEYGSEGGSIVINEAVELTKRFADEEDYQFVNGVLGALARTRFAERVKQPEQTAEEPVCTPLE
ncbi:MAG: transcription antitermination factor NusB [Pygmaiobacter massiliensis]|nr:transcription antitermination factor NusB [Pygmaiobacter massiliensis]